MKLELKIPKIGNSFLIGSQVVKPEKILIFLKNGKNSKIAEMVQGSLEFFLDLG